MADVGVRLAIPTDADELARIQAEVWAEVHAGALPADLLEAVGSTEAADRWRVAIAEPPSPRHRVLAALVGERVSASRPSPRRPTRTRSPAGRRAAGPLRRPGRDPSGQRLAAGQRLGRHRPRRRLPPPARLARGGRVGPARLPGGGRLGGGRRHPQPRPARRRRGRGRADPAAHGARRPVTEPPAWPEVRAPSSAPPCRSGWPPARTACRSAPSAWRPACRWRRPARSRC